MRQKEVELEINGRKEKVIMKRLTAGERNDALRQAIKMNMGALGHNTEVDTLTYQEHALAKSIVSAPFEKGVSGIRSLDPEHYNLLWETFQELNEVSDKKKSQLNQLSIQEVPAQAES